MPAFDPLDPEFESAVRASFDRLTLMRTLGARLEGVSAGEVEIKANFLAPAQGERMVARGRVIRPGRTITVCAGDVVAVDRGTETLVATLLATMMRIGNERLPSPTEAKAPDHQPVAHRRPSRRWCLCRAWNRHRRHVTASV